MLVRRTGGGLATVQAVDKAFNAAVATTEQATDSEEDLVAPTEEFRRTALVASKEEVLSPRLYRPAHNFDASVHKFSRALL